MCAQSGQGGPAADAVLAAAVEQGELGRIDRAVALGASLRGVLHRALGVPAPSAAVVRALLGHGCAVWDRVDGRTAVHAARARGLHDLAELILDPANHGGPRWHREFVADAGPRIVVVVRMADGFGFDADDVVHPFREGGWRDGHGWPLDAQAGRAHFERLLPAWGERLGWFGPFVDKIVRGEDFSLRALVRDAGERLMGVEYCGDPESTDAPGSP